MHRLPPCHTLVTSRFAARLPVARSATYACAVDVESFDERSGGIGEIDGAPDRPAPPLRPSGPMGWLKDTNHSPAVIAFLRRARRALPGDPDFGDPLSVDGVGGPRAAARAADRLLERDAASREVSLGALQVWQALTERVSGKPANREVTLVFTDLVGLLGVVVERRRRGDVEVVAPRFSGRRAAAAGGRRSHRQADGRRHHGGVLRTRHRGARRHRCS